jgi:transcription-repair coupling factor (superfamily II helicase)
MERLPQPTAWGRLSISLKAGTRYAEEDLKTRLQGLGYSLDEEAEYPGAGLFHGKTFEIFPAGALGPFRVEHSGGLIQKIVAVDPGEHDAMFETKELLIDPMSERLALRTKGGERAVLPDYFARARWMADAGVLAHADSWLERIEEAAGRKETEHDYIGRVEEAGEAYQRSASQRDFQEKPRLLKTSVATQSSPRVHRRRTACGISAALRRRGGGRSARHGAHGRNQDGAVHRLAERDGLPKPGGRGVGRLRCGLH